MNGRIIWMFLAGLAVAAGLLVFIRLLDAGRIETQGSVNGADSSGADTAQNLTINSDLNASITPANFRTISETDDGLNLNGTGQAGAVVSVLNNGTPLRQVRVNENGIWSTRIGILPDEIMEISLLLTLTAEGSNGGSSGDNLGQTPSSIIGSDETVFRVPLPLTGLNAPRSGLIQPGGLAVQAGAITPPPALIVVTAPGGPSRIVQSPFGGLPVDGPLRLGPIDYDDMGGVIFSGTSSRAGRVRIYANESVIGDTGVGPSGRWFYIAGETLAVGAYDITVELMGADVIEARVVIPFERLAPPSPAAADDTFIKFEPQRWQLRRKLFGGGAQYTAIFAPSSADELPVPQAVPVENPQ